MARSNFEKTVMKLILKAKKGIIIMDKKYYETLKNNIEIVPVYVSEEEYSKKMANLCKILLELYDEMENQDLDKKECA